MSRDVLENDDSYRQMRHALFQFLITFGGMDTTLQSRVKRLSPLFDHHSRNQFETLMNQGSTLISVATTQARVILAWEADIPVADESLLRLFPLIPRETAEQLFASLEMMKQWSDDMTAFLDAHEI